MIKGKETHWVSLFIDRNTVVYFDSFEIKYIFQEMLNKVSDKSITKNIFSLESNDSTMCGFDCITFIEYILSGKTLSNYTNLFSPNDF